MYLLGEIIASTLRVLGKGLKVIYEISLITADPGLVRSDEDIMAMAVQAGEQI